MDSTRVRVSLFLLLLCALAARAAQPAIDPALHVRYQDEANAMTWRWDGDDNFREFCEQRAQKSPKASARYQVEVIYPQGDHFFRFRTLRILDKDNRVALEQKLNPEAQFDVLGDTCYLLDYSTCSEGFYLMAFDLAGGKKIWHKSVMPLEGVMHSAYSNSVCMDARNDAIVVTGQESIGAYVRFIDPRNGRTLAHRDFDPSAEGLHLRLSIDHDRYAPGDQMRICALMENEGEVKSITYDPNVILPGYILHIIEPNGRTRTFIQPKVLRAMENKHTAKLQKGQSVPVLDTNIEVKTYPDDAWIDYGCNENDVRDQKENANPVDEESPKPLFPAPGTYYAYLSLHESFSSRPHSNVVKFTITAPGGSEINRLAPQTFEMDSSYKYHGYQFIDYSPSGDYMIFCDISDNPNSSGVWLTGKNSPGWCRIWWGDVNSFNWLPDESGVIVGVSRHIDGSKPPRWSHTLSRVMLKDGLTSRLLKMDSVLRSLVMPDGSGLVLLDAYDYRPGAKEDDEGTWRLRVQRYDFAADDLSTIWTSPRSPAGYDSIGDVLAIRKDGGDWALSVFSPSTWLNLRTGEMRQGKGRPVDYSYSPDGKHVIANSVLYDALSWPTASGGVTAGKAILPIPLPKDKGATYIWSSDGRYVTLVRWDAEKRKGEAPAPVYDVVAGRIAYTLPSAVQKQKAWVVGWAGPKSLLVERRDASGEYSLFFTIPLKSPGANLADKDAIFRIRWTEKRY